MEASYNRKQQLKTIQNGRINPNEIDILESYAHQPGRTLLNRAKPNIPTKKKELTQKQR